MTKFITLAGCKQTGKDTSAGFIKELLVPVRTEKQPNGCMDALFEEGPYANKVHVVHFADALKEACSLIFGIPLIDMETEEGKQKETGMHWPYLNEQPYHYDNWMPDPNGKHMTVREVLQFVGTDLFRNQLDPDIWVKSVFSQPYSDDDVVIIADARFPNEASFSKEQGLLIKINRNTGLSADSHISETALDDYNNYDYIIDNNGSLEELRDKLSVVLKEQGLL